MTEEKREYGAESGQGGLRMNNRASLASLPFLSKMSISLCKVTLVTLVTEFTENISVVKTRGSLGKLRHFRHFRHFSQLPLAQAEHGAACCPSNIIVSMSRYLTNSKRYFIHGGLDSFLSPNRHSGSTTVHGRAVGNIFQIIFRFRTVHTSKLTQSNNRKVI